ncbi:MAG: tRNA uridine-5-carboxymethylaminomethyl(34) synthesis GTPase MnmE [SAR86 cluster bacterium]|jgi:tRNA modification GTPase|nr:tRNA uridine-5-carboxymethylaminomethyl(34) synthesis GTPase MnmE [SAR86 cluster bacterium]
MLETIVAPATSVGKGGVGIVRLSGEKSRLIGSALCGDLSEPWKVKKCTVSDSDKEMIDSGLVVYFKAPNSYTGEDVVEIHCHGNPLLLDLITRAAIKEGARMALPGEFTERAFLNEKIDLAQAESVADLISAESLEAIKVAESSLKGDFSNKINLVIDKVLKMRVNIEAGLDFPEDETDEKEDALLEGLLEEIIQEVNSILEGSKRGALLRDGFKVSIIGPPNSGKSTLVNRLAQENIAIVSSVPGTTRDPIRKKINLDGFVIEIVDTAGVREKTSDPIEKEGIKRTVSEKVDSDLVLYTCSVDTNHKHPDFNEEPMIKIYTKADLGEEKRFGAYKDFIYISAQEERGLDVLTAEILKVLGVSEKSQVPILARRRHIVLIEGCLQKLYSCGVALKERGQNELCAEFLREGQDILGQITRPVASEDLLEEIFSSFCIGK